MKNAESIGLSGHRTADEDGCRTSRLGGKATLSTLIRLSTPTESTPPPGSGVWWEVIGAEATNDETTRHVVDASRPDPPAFFVSALKLLRFAEPPLILAMSLSARRATVSEVCVRLGEIRHHRHITHSKASVADHICSQYQPRHVHHIPAACPHHVDDHKVSFVHRQ